MWNLLTPQSKLCQITVHCSRTKPSNRDQIFKTTVNVFWEFAQSIDFHVVFVKGEAYNSVMVHSGRVLALKLIFEFYAFPQLKFRYKSVCSNERRCYEVGTWIHTELFLLFFVTWSGKYCVRYVIAVTNYIHQDFFENTFILFFFLWLKSQRYCLFICHSPWTLN